MSWSEKALGRSLGLGIKDFTVTREANQCLDAARPIKSIRLCWQTGPVRGQITGEWTAMTLLIGEASEVEQEAAFNAQGITKRTPVAQILFGPRQHGVRALHRRVLGHGRATFRNCDKFPRA